MGLDYNEILCESIDTIVKDRINQVSFDKTIVCTIVDDSDRENGHYIVTNEDLRFDAYCDYKRYRRREQVQVLIPGGDFSAPQKTIIGRYSSDAKQRPVTYVKPFDQLVLMSDNLVSKERSKEYSLIINELQKDGTRKSEIEILNLQNLNKLNTFTSIGLKASFKTLLDNWFITKGDYGLRFKLTGKDDEGVSQEVSIDFSKNELFGNPYSFSIYSPQEGKIDITGLGLKIIEGIKISLYQKGNFFVYDNLITYPEYEAFPQDIEKPFPNLYVKDLELYFANDVMVKENDIIEIYCDSLLYDMGENTKYISNIWYHKDINNKYIGYTDVDENHDYSLQWFYFKQGIWEKIDEKPYKENLDKPKEIKLRTNLKKDYIKVVLFYNGIPYESNILTFENIGIKDDPLAADRVAALTIHLGEKAERAYPMYGDDNTLINASQSRVNRELKLYYAPLQLNLTKEEFFKKAEITWYVPIGGMTMLSYDEDFLKEKKYSKVDNRPGYMGFTKKSENGQSEDFNFYFQIKDFYNKSSVVNTIECVAIYDEVDYRAKVSFDFTSYGSNGTNYTPIIIAKNGERFYTNPNGQEVILEAKLYDPDFNEIKLSKKVKGVVRDVEWFYLDGTKIEETDLDFQINESGLPLEDRDATKLKANFANDKYNVVRADIKVNSKLKVSCFYSLPYCNKDITNYYAVAPTEIIYNNAGVRPKYYRGEINLYDIQNNQPVKTYLSSDIIWDEKYLALEEKVNPQDNIKFLPAIDKENETNNYILRAPRMYMHDISVGPTIEASAGKTLLWRQSIIILSNSNDFDLLNSWDGNLTIDKEDNYILSAMVGAGRKDDDNTFSGVLMGDIKKAKGDNHAFGLYGYNKGEQSFSVDINGKATIGKTGRGQIIIDGDIGSITSGNYRLDRKTGMKIDLGNGHIDSFNFLLTSENLLLDSSAEQTGDYFKIGSNDNIIALNKKEGLSIKTNNFLLKAGTANGDPFIIKSKLDTFQEVNGKLEPIGNYLEIGNMTYGRFFEEGINEKGKPDGKKVIQERFKVTGGLIEGAHMKAGSIVGSYIEAGTLIANQGQIGGWMLANDKLYAEGKESSLYLSATGNTVINVGGSKTTFAVNRNGEMKATGAVFDSCYADQFNMGGKWLKPESITIPTATSTTEQYVTGLTVEEDPYLYVETGYQTFNVDMHNGTVRVGGLGVNLGGLVVTSVIPTRNTISFGSKTFNTIGYW